MAQLPPGFVLEEAPQGTGDSGLPEGFQLESQREWSDVPAEALRNFGPSAARFAWSMIEPFLDPIKTITVLDKIKRGVGSKIASTLLDPILAALGLEQDKEVVAEIEKEADAVWKALVDRYGSEEALKKTLATDPVGVAADISTILMGGAALPGRAGQIARAGSRITDPAAAAVNLTGAAVRQGGRLAAGAMGLPTGVGRLPIEQAFLSGQQGGQNARTFRENISGRAPVEGVSDMAERAFSNMRQGASNDYQLGTAALRQSQTPMDLAPIDQAFRDARGSLTFGGYTKKPKTMKVLEKLEKQWGDFKDQFAGKQVTAEALDAFKQNVTELLGTLDYKKGDARRVVGGINDALRTHINNTVPDYAAAMQNYARQKTMLEEMRRETGVGKDPAARNTSLRKLLAAQRSGVNTNFGRRTRMVEDLATQGNVPDLPAAIAGQTLQEAMPQGLARLGAMGGMAGGGAALGLGVIPTLPMYSPRVMGEAAYWAGVGSRPVAAAAAPVMAGMRSGAPLAARAVGETMNAADPNVTAVDEAQVMQDMILQNIQQRQAGTSGPTRVTVTPQLSPEEQQMLADYLARQGAR